LDLDERIRQFGGVREIAASIEHDEGRANLNELMKKRLIIRRVFKCSGKAILSVQHCVSRRAAARG